jgi:hypothetical protein
MSNKLHPIEKSKLRKPRTNQDGFFIAELLVTIVTAGLIFGAFMTIFTTIQAINKKSRDIQQANTVAFAKSQEYENKNFADIPTMDPIGSLNEVEDFSTDIPETVHSPRVAKVFVNSISPTLKHLVIRVEFDEGPAKQTIQYVDFIQRYGVGR